MHIAVTGGAGYIGSSIVRELVERGHRVRVIDDLSKGKRDNLTKGGGSDELLDDVELIEDDAGVAAHAYKDVDAIVHAAAYPDVSDNWAHPREREAQWISNAELTRAVLEHARLGVRFVFISTCSVYGPGHVTEQNAPRATSPYAASKLAAEAWVSCFSEAGRIRATTLRLVNVVGPRYAHGHLADFVRKATGDGHIHALDDGKKAKSFVHVADVAETVADAVDERLIGIAGAVVRLANVTSRYVWSWRDSIAVMRAMRPKKTFDLTCEARPNGWIGDPDELVVSSVPLAGFPRRSIVEGVEAALVGLGW